MTTLTERIVGLNGFVGIKPPVKAATTANITLSGEQTIDGIAVVTSDRVLVKDQTDGVENGIWIVSTGAWSRSKDFNGARDVVSGTQVLVNSGSINGARIYRITTADDITIGTTSIAFDVVDATNVRNFGTRSDITGTPVGSAITHLRTAGYTTVGDGGGALYKRATSEPAHALKIQSADGAWWEIAEPHIITFQACGGTEGDNAANGAGNVAAFNDFVGYLQEQAASGFVKGPTLVFPIVAGSGVYHFNTHLNVKAVVHITGPAGWHQAAAQGPRLVFPADSHGLIVHRSNTIDDTTESPSTYGADGSLIENLSLEGGGNTNTTGHGIWIRAFCTVRHCEVKNFAQNGFNVVGGIGAGGSLEGNASFFKIENCLANGNGRSGCYIEGGDANAGHTIGCDFRDSGRWGLWDSSFLGNTHISHHAVSNGGDNDGGNAGTSCVATFGGSTYILNVDASEADAVATQPGTDKAVWIEKSGLNNGVAWTGSDPEGTFHHGGGYRCTGANTRSVFLGCYLEPGSAAQFKKPTLWIGGHESGDTFGSHGGWAPNVNATQMKGNYRFSNVDAEFPLVPSREVVMDLNANRDQPLRVIAIGDDVFGMTFGWWRENDGLYGVGTVGLNDAKTPMFVTSDLTSRAYGRASAVGGGKAAFENGLFLHGGDGGGQNARFMAFSNAAPTSGEHARGELYWNRDQSTGGVVAWLCTAGGTPGTWVELRGGGSQQPHIADPSGGGTVDAEARTAINSILAVLEHFGLTAAS